jgi:hypothetical protein
MITNQQDMTMSSQVIERSSEILSEIELASLRGTLLEAVMQD